MRFENIQNMETLEKFFTSRGFEIQEYDKSLIRIDKLHFLQIKIVDVLDRDAAYQEHKEFKNKFRDVPYQLLAERTFQKFMFQRDRGTPLRFTYDLNFWLYRHYALNLCTYTLLSKIRRKLCKVFIYA